MYYIICCCAFYI